MNAALIYPPSLLLKYGTTTKYHMALPNLCHQKRYSDFYRTRSRKGDWIILDNGAAEDIAFGPKHLLTLASHIKANELVVPDVLFDIESTLAQALSFSRFAQPNRDDGKPLRYMLVLQGSNMSEFTKCLYSYLEMPGLAYATTIAIPRLITTATDNAFARIRMAEYIRDHQLDTAMEYHFLGATSWLFEASALAELEMARGIDTSAPVYMGLKDLDIEKDDYISRPADYFDTAEDRPLVKQNIKTYLKWTKYEYKRPSD